MRLLVRIIADHRPLGIASAMPYDLYQRVLGKNPDKAIAHPYYVSFYGLIAFVAEDLAAKGLKEKVRGAKLAAVSTCHGRLVPAISIIGVCAFRYRTFAGLYSYNFVSQDSDVGQRHLRCAFLIDIAQTSPAMTYRPPPRVLPLLRQVVASA